MLCSIYWLILFDFISLGFNIQHVQQVFPFLELGFLQRTQLLNQSSILVLANGIFNKWSVVS